MIFVLLSFQAGSFLSLGGTFIAVGSISMRGLGRSIGDSSEKRKGCPLRAGDEVPTPEVGAVSTSSRSRVPSMYPFSRLSIPALNRNDPRTDPCRAPALIFRGSDVVDLILTRMYLSVKKSAIISR